MYHLILMDIIMPNMGGLASTDLIRKMELDTKQTVKNHIIAISADERELIMPKIL